MLAIGILGLATMGCGKAKDPAWALQHGTLEVQADGAVGYQVWEFFSKRWRKKRDEKFHICSRVQDLTAPAADPIDGCDDCEVFYSVRAEELETDCDSDAATKAGFGAMTHMAFGPLPSEFDGDDPYPGSSLGWYQSWDGQTVELMGYAWNEVLDEGEDPAVEGWSEGERFVLWPAYAWEL